MPFSVEGGHDLLGLGLLDPRVVGALGDQQRDPDVADPWTAASAPTGTSSSVSGLPTRVWNWAIIGAQYGGIDSISVLQVDGPTMSTAQRNTSGVKAAPTSAA